MIRARVRAQAVVESSTASDAPESASKGCIKHVCKKAVALSD